MAEGPTQAAPQLLPSHDLLLLLLLLGAHTAKVSQSVWQDKEAPSAVVA